MTNTSLAVLCAREYARLMIQDARKAKAAGRISVVQHYVRQARRTMHVALTRNEFGDLLRDYITGR
jgi:hypothetical protein